jgi:UDP-N-acetylmuramate dehydrogenase
VADSLANLRYALGPRVIEREMLAAHTTFRIGGPADLFIGAKTIDNLTECVRLAREHQGPILILGLGSNVLFPDNGFRGLVIKNQCVHFDIKGIQGEVAYLHSESGAPLPGVANRLGRQGWSGLEWAIGIPGTIGGAVVGNAGAQSGAIADNLLAVSILDSDGMVRELPKTDLGLAYRTSRFKQAKKEIVLSADFEMKRDDPQACIARMEQYTKYRHRTQPTEPSVGSIFKNPPGSFAGRMIEQAGLKGERVGGVEVSRVHANFFVNRGNATAKDVIKLIEIVRGRVRDLYGVELKLEIEVIGTLIPGSGN